jgi:hypothetical protein
VDCPPNRSQPGNPRPENWLESYVIQMTSGRDFGLTTTQVWKTWPDFLPAKLTE